MRKPRTFVRGFLLGGGLGGRRATEVYLGIAWSPPDVVFSQPQRGLAATTRAEAGNSWVVVDLLRFHRTLTEAAEDWPGIILDRGKYDRGVATCAIGAGEGG